MGSGGVDSQIVVEFGINGFGARQKNDGALKWSDRRFLGEYIAHNWR